MHVYTCLRGGVCTLGLGVQGGHWAWGGIRSPAAVVSGEFECLMCVLGPQ